MTNLKRVLGSQDIKEKQVVLFIDKEDKKVRGIDRIISINPNSNEYCYNPLSKPHDFSLPYQTFTGNLTRNLNNFDAYIVDEDFAYKYCDKAFDIALLSWDSSCVMTFCVGAIGNVLWNLVVEHAKRNIHFRMEFIDLTLKHDATLRKIIFLETQKNVSKEELEALKNDINLLKVN